MRRVEDEVEVEEMEEDEMEDSASSSRTCGSSPNISPSLRVERIRRIRWAAGRALRVGGGGVALDVVDVVCEYGMVLG